MQFQKIYKSVFCLVLALSGLSSAHASNLVSFVSYPGDGGSGAFSIDQVNSSISRQGAAYDVRAQTFYGTNRAYAAGSGSDSASAESAWTVTFNLLGVPAGTPVPIIVNVAYEHSILATGPSSTAAFYIRFNGDNFFRAAASYTSTNAFDADFCPELPGARPLGQCAGAHSGAASRTIQYSGGLNQSLTVAVAVGISGSGVSDAFNTARVSSIIIPDGTIFEYTDLSGNPLNVMTASQAAATGVPEPGTLGMLGAGIAAILFAKAKQAKKS